MRNVVVAGLFGLLSTLLSILLPRYLQQSVDAHDALTYTAVTSEITYDLVKGLPDVDPTIKPKRFLTIVQLSNPTSQDVDSFNVELKLYGEGAKEAQLGQRESTGFYSNNGKFVPRFDGTFVANYDRFPSGEHQTLFILAGEPVFVEGFATSRAGIEIARNDQAFFQKMVSAADRNWWWGLLAGIGISLLTFASMRLAQFYLRRRKAAQ